MPDRTVFSTLCVIFLEKLIVPSSWLEDTDLSSNHDLHEGCISIRNTMYRQTGKSIPH